MSMNVLDAAFNVGHDFPGGVPALALRLGMSANVLQKKLDPKIDTHHLRLDEAVKSELISGDPRVLHAHAEALGFVAIQIPNVPAGGDGLLDEILDTSTSHADVMQKFKDMYADRVVSKSELPEFDRAIYQAIVQLIEFKRRCMRWPSD